MTLARSRGSAVSARHIAVSSGFISAAMPQSSGTSGGADPSPAPASVTVGRCLPDQLARVSTYLPRTSSTFAPRSSVVQPSVGTGGRTRTCTVPEWIVVEPRHISSPALRMTMGMIGTPACIATWNAPFLNGPSDGVAERVPSGAMTSEMPSRSFCTAGSSALRASVAFFAVDEGDVGQPEGQPEAGRVRQLLLGHAGEAAAQHLGQDQHVELALVVEEEDRRPGGQVLGALHVDAGRPPARCPARRPG